MFAGCQRQCKGSGEISDEIRLFRCCKAKKKKTGMSLGYIGETEKAT
jgi:hypothetical protein